MSKAPQVITTFLIFSLSAGVLGGILFYMDTAGPSVLDDLTEELPVDMEISMSSSFYRQNETEISFVEDLLNQHDLVSHIEPISVIEGTQRFMYVYDPGDPYGFYYDYQRVVFLGVSDGFFETFPDAVSLSSGAPSLTDTTCYLEENIFISENYEIGDDYIAEVLTYDDYYEEVPVNKTYEIVGTFSSDLFPVEYYYYYEDLGDRDSSLIMITTKESLNEGFEELGFGRWDGISERFWVDLNRDAIIQADVTTIYDTLDNIRRQFEQDALPYALVSDYGIQDAVYQYSAWSMGMTAIALSFSIPSIIMGVLLIYYNSNLLSDELRRDVGSLKTRGASGWQAFSWIVSSAIFTGLLGSAGAILMGIGASILSSTVRTFFVFNFAQLSDLTLILSSGAILSIFIFSFGVGLVVAFPIGIRAYLMTATEAHKILEQESLSQQENQGSPLMELIVLGISGYILLPMMSFIGYVSFYGSGSIVLMLFLIPLMVAFIVSFARLLARPISRYKSRIMGRIKRPSIRVGARVMSRTVLMYKKSEAMGVVFIAMVFAAGVFAATSATTGLNHTNSIFKFYTGADIAITVDSSLNNVTLDLLENLTAVEGVAQVSPIYSFTGSISYYTSDWGNRYFVNTSIPVYAVDPETWLETAFWLPYFTLHGTPESAINQMIGDESIVLSSFRPIDHYVGSGFTQTPVYANEFDLAIYGSYWINATHGSKWVNETTVTIADVLSNSDSWGSTYLPGEPNANDFVVVDIDYAHRCLNVTNVNKFFVKTIPGANYTQVMRDLWNVAPSSFNGIESPYPQIDDVLDSKAGQTIYGVYTLNVVFTIIYLSIGMMIVATVRIRRLRKQFSVLRALGTESKSISGSVLIDTTLGLLVASAIGALIGLILSYFAINMPLVYFGTGTINMWLRLPVIMAIPPDILGIILGCSFVFALIATFYVTSRTLKKNIAEQIQYSE